MTTHRSSPESADINDAMNEVYGLFIKHAPCLSDEVPTDDLVADLAHAMVRSHAQRQPEPSATEIAKLMDKHGIPPAKPNFWLELEALLSPVTSTNSAPTYCTPDGPAYCTENGGPIQRCPTCPVTSTNGGGA